MKRGIFITCEGPDGSGKTTQIENIKRYFAERNFEIVFTREPGGTVIGERIRQIILDTQCREMDAVTETMLYAAARAQHVAQVISPALDAGKVVICDRFVDSSIAYQGFGRNLGDMVEAINQYAIKDCMPDLTILFKLDPSVAKGRICEEVQDRLEEEKVSFHYAVYQGYLHLEEKYKDRYFGIDASRSIELIKEEICNKLDEVLLAWSEKEK